MEERAIVFTGADLSPGSWGLRRRRQSQAIPGQDVSECDSAKLYATRSSAPLTEDRISLRSPTAPQNPSIPDPNERSSGNRLAVLMLRKIDGADLDYGTDIRNVLTLSEGKLLPGGWDGKRPIAAFPLSNSRIAHVTLQDSPHLLVLTFYERPSGNAGEDPMRVNFNLIEACEKVIRHVFDMKRNLYKQQGMNSPKDIVELSEIVDPEIKNNRYPWMKEEDIRNGNQYHW